MPAPHRIEMRRSARIHEGYRRLRVRRIRSDGRGQSLDDVLVELLRTHADVVFITQDQRFYVWAVPA